MTRRVTHGRLWIASAYVLGSLLFASTYATARADDKADGFDQGVRLHVAGKTIDIPNISRTSTPTTLALRLSPNKRPIVICSVGRGILPKINQMEAAGFDPGDCVIFVDAQTEECVRVAYHQPRPERIVVSPDGRYVAMASASGWGSGDAPLSIPKQKQLDRLSRWRHKDFDFDTQLKQAQVGTLRYSIWELDPPRPLWELRFDHNRKEPDAHTVDTFRFVRPWERYSTINLPWWAREDGPSVYNNCEITFSDDAKYVLALEPRIGVLVVDLESGKQFLCSSPRPGSEPLILLVGSDDSFSVVCRDGIVRQYSCKSPDEIVQSRTHLPRLLQIRDTGSGSWQINFAFNRERRMACVSANETMSFLNFNMPDDKTDVVYPRFGTFSIPQRVDVSADGRFVGLKHIFNESGTMTRPTELGRTCSYRIIDLRDRKIRGQVVDRELQGALTKDDGALLDNYVADGEFAAYLGPEGRVIFVEPLPE